MWNEVFQRYIVCGGRSELGSVSKSSLRAVFFIFINNLRERTQAVKSRCSAVGAGALVEPRNIPRPHFCRKPLPIPTCLFSEGRYRLTYSKVVLGLPFRALLVLVALCAGSAHAEDAGEAARTSPGFGKPHPSGRYEGICRTMERSAADNNLPIEFFTRVIWQESNSM